LVAAALAYARRHRERFLAELADFVRFPSVSADPRHADDVVECAGWLAGHLRALGAIGVRIVPTARHPVVHAAWRHETMRPTVLIYGHYDVVSADPLEAWRSPPFEATRQGESLYGRGTSDDKGQLFAHLKAVESLLRTSGTLPANVVCLCDGEEEIGSPSLAAFLASQRDAFQADAVVVSDTPILGPGRPALTYALRGLLSLEARVSGPRRDLHSGRFGGAVHNPAQVLCDLVSSLHDSSGRVAVAGFYDRVRPARAVERAAMARMGPTDAQVRRDAGVDKAWGESGYTLFERLTLRPALSVNGLSGGHAGPGLKTVIPASARTKLSVRLVPDQDPEEIADLLKQHFERLAPATVRLATVSGAAVRPFLADRDHPALPVTLEAYRKGFGSAPAFLRAGGSIPAVTMLQDALGQSPLLMGFALPDDGMHGPNERLHLPTFWSAIETSIWLLAGLAQSFRVAS
jgi:acetylornithine deacetylase/succinyl-diaminopimelate desuccinylase-like protein